MTPEQRTAKRAEMQRRWLAGETGPQIVDAIGVQLNTIHRWRVDLGLPPHGPHAPVSPRTQERLPLLIEWRARGLSVMECAKLLGVSKGVVTGLIHRNDIPDPPSRMLERRRAASLAKANAANAERAAARRAAAAPKPLVRHPTGPVKPVARWTPAEELLPRAPVVPTNGCQFPQGTPGRAGFRFCGEVREGTGPYCSGCRRICWQRVPTWERAA